MRLRARDDIHLARRLWHMSGVLLVFVLYWNMTYRTAVFSVFTVSAFMITYDVARLWFPQLNQLFLVFFGRVLRESERNRIAGSTFMCLGITLSVIVFPKEVVLLMLLFFATADPLASYFGIRFGKDKLIGNKTLQGSLAAFVACFLVSTIYFYTMDLMRERLFIVCLLSGLIGALSELVPIGKLDDNLVFPVLSSTLLTGMFYIFGGLI